MRSNTYFITTTILFIVVAIGHFLRVAYGWNLNVGGTDIPMWLSWTVVIFVGFLAIHGYRLNRTHSQR